MSGRAAEADRGRVVVPPAELDLTSPGRRDYWVALEHDELWAEWRIPLTVMVGTDARAGEGVAAFGATHGNEYEGPVALQHVANDIGGRSLAGRIVLIPVLNPAALRTATRDGAGVNLNRAFVPGAGESAALGTITYRIARFVREHIWPHVHVVVDLHSGGNVARFAPIASFHRSDDPAQQAGMTELARWFGMPFVCMYQNRTPGLLTSEAERLGKLAVGTELGWGGAVNRQGVAYARQGVLAAAVHHAGLDWDLAPAGDHAGGTQTLVDMSDSACCVGAERPGWYEPLVDCGAKVTADEPVGLVHDLDRIDEAPLPVRAPVDGRVIAQAWLAEIVTGQHVVVVAREVPWT